MRLAVLLLVPLLSGCAFIANGDRQSIALRSTPEGAEVVQGGEVIGTTPTLLRFKRGQRHTLTFRKEGYRDVTVQINRLRNGSVCLNGSNWLGYLLDFQTGSAYRLAPDDIEVTLREEDLATADEGAIHVVFVTPEALAQRRGVGTAASNEEAPHEEAATPPGACSR